MFICGSGSFSHQDEDEKVPKRSKRNRSFCKTSKNKNPYAERGLDKFYALLADLDNKKQKIYTQKGAEDISFVRFVYKNDSNRVKPIVVKVKEEKKKQEKPMINKNSSNLNQVDMVSSDDVPNKATATTVASQSTPKEELNEKRPKKRRCLRCNGSFKLDSLRQPYVYFPVIVLFVLMFLAMYGRSFAILCTSIGWYMVPTIVGGSSPSSSSSSSNERKPKGKEYARKQSEKKIDVHREGPSSPKSVINGLIEIK